MTASFRTRFAVIAIVMAYLCLLGYYGLLEPDEGRYAEMGREMLNSGDFIIPTLNGIPHFQKPPMINYATALSLGIFGNNEIGARMPNVFAGLSVLALTYLIGLRWFSVQIGRIACWMLAGCLLFFMLSRTLTPDMMMTFWATASIASFALATTQKKPRIFHFIPYFLCMGLAFATKGPVGLIVPWVTGIGWQWRRRDTSPPPRIPWILFPLITLPIALSWFIACSIRHPELASYFFKYEFLERLFSKTHGRSQPFWFFLPVLILGWMPWAPFAALSLAKRKETQPSTRPESYSALFAWILPPLLLLSLSGSKLLTYVLPLFPGIALWLASQVSSCKDGRLLKGCANVQQGFFGVLTLGTLTLLFLGKSKFNLDLNNVALAGTVMASVLGMLASRQLRAHLTEQKVIAVSLVAMLCWLTLLLQLPHLGPQLGIQTSLKPLAERIKADPEWPQATFAMIGSRGHGLEFYLERFTSTFRNHADIVLEPDNPTALRLLDGPQDIDKVLLSGQPVFLVTHKRNQSDLRPEAWTFLQQQGAFMLYKSIAQKQ
ncbi:glycosyltransferase family 39 protein [Kiritimatiellota bacterium B12222]|nr:glycosyltransferase family 39 protein [Kiritimatiellota bacterium B12222]